MKLDSCCKITFFLLTGNIKLVDKLANLPNNSSHPVPVLWRTRRKGGEFNDPLLSFFFNAMWQPWSLMLLHKCNKLMFVSHEPYGVRENYLCTALKLWHRRLDACLLSFLWNWRVTWKCDKLMEFIQARRRRLSLSKNHNCQDILCRQSTRKWLFHRTNTHTIHERSTSLCIDRPTDLTCSWRKTSWRFPWCYKYPSIHPYIDFCCCYYLSN